MKRPTGTPPRYFVGADFSTEQDGTVIITGYVTEDGQIHVNDRTYHRRPMSRQEKIDQIVGMLEQGLITTSEAQKMMRDLDSNRPALVIDVQAQPADLSELPPSTETPHE